MMTTLTMTTMMPPPWWVLHRQATGTTRPRARALHRCFPSHSSSGNHIHRLYYTHTKTKTKTAQTQRKRQAHSLTQTSSALLLSLPFHTNQSYSHCDCHQRHQISIWRYFNADNFQRSLLPYLSLFRVSSNKLRKRAQLKKCTKNSKWHMPHHLP